MATATIKSGMKIGKRYDGIKMTARKAQYVGQQCECKRQGEHYNLFHDGIEIGMFSKKMLDFDTKPQKQSDTPFNSHDGEDAT